MKNTTIFLAGVFVALAIFALCKGSKENWVTGTYVNTPTQQGVYPTWINNWWGGNYYQRLNWLPWGYHRPGYYRRRPGYGIGPGYIEPSQFGTLFRYGRIEPLSPIRCPYGRWEMVGTAYTENKNDPTVVDVYKINVDPPRELFYYMIETRKGYRLPIKFPENEYLVNGDKFKVDGWEGKGNFIYIDDYRYNLDKIIR